MRITRKENETLKWINDFDKIEENDEINYDTKINYDATHKSQKEDIFIK